MTWKTKFAAVVLIIGVSSTASAIDLCMLLACHPCWPSCIGKTCCDDYCSKPLPCVPKLRCFGCDDYTPKCAPCTPRVRCFGCDDYDPKCEPVIQCAPAAELKCVPMEPARVPCNCGQCARCQHRGVSKR